MLSRSVPRFLLEAAFLVAAAAVAALAHLDAVEIVPSTRSSARRSRS